MGARGDVVVMLAAVCMACAYHMQTPPDNNNAALAKELAGWVQAYDAKRSNIKCFCGDAGVTLFQDDGKNIVARISEIQTVNDTDLVTITKEQTKINISRTIWAAIRYPGANTQTQKITGEAAACIQLCKFNF
jgi:hypothetical protein